MATHSQPIALPSNNSSDVHMADPPDAGPSSYSGNGPFNPASYTRHFLGSPLSWRGAASFGSRFYPGGSPGQMLGPLDPHDFKTGKLSSSVESDRGSILNAINVIEREGEMCRNFTCCGLPLPDLHALLEHFEDVHVLVYDPAAAAPPFPAPPPFPSAFDPDDMELDTEPPSLSSSLTNSPSPPASPHHPNDSVHPSMLTSASPRPPPPSSLNINGNLNGNGGANGNIQTPATSTTLARPASSLLLSKPFRCPKPNCNKSYKQANGLKYHMTHGSCNYAPRKEVEAVEAVLAARRAAHDSHPPSPSSSHPHSSSDPNSSSHNSGGVGAHDEYTPTPTDLLSIEAEAARRLRPFACGVGECSRRYKNMNGLRYHYAHSGEHGAVGLGMLASGRHEVCRGVPGVGLVGGGSVRRSHSHSSHSHSGSRTTGSATPGQMTPGHSQATTPAASRGGTPMSGASTPMSAGGGGGTTPVMQSAGFQQQLAYAQQQQQQGQYVQPQGMQAAAQQHGIQVQAQQMSSQGMQGQMQGQGMQGQGQQGQMQYAMPGQQYSMPGQQMYGA
ncbi:hypothetical protein PLICRDRAFT_179104 [Plicaturopsis crispa FD-325 SS-3]|uniref:Unplaced genomic scaffold PLICRscaffold_16, whole genome shotgun sequence n=1 Tax=Plicaturopsis crispa FD-325 SS-3 TaxID=944288 RepID=A0A0C9SRK9_PLICR|nr:hypothetical protein PLICRDRAFT_179104 [Plicaturopsis crispa FD-325 SS-3]